MSDVQVRSFCDDHGLSISHVDGVACVSQRSFLERARMHALGRVESRSAELNARIISPHAVGFLLIAFVALGLVVSMFTSLGTKHLVIDGQRLEQGASVGLIVKTAVSDVMHTP